MKLKFFTAWVLVGFFLLPGYVFAQNSYKEQAIGHFQNGLNLLKAKNYKGAVSEFETSVELFESKNALFNLANCYEALHRYQEALDTFDRLEKTFGESIDDAMRESVARHRETILTLVGELVIKVDNPGAQISVDGKVIGESPLDRSYVLGPGEYDVAVSLQKFETFNKRVRLTSGQQVDLNVVLTPSPAELIVNAHVGGAIVRVDGEVVGITPLPAPIELTAGEHTIEVVKDGYTSSEQTVTVASAEKLGLDFTLVDKSGPKPTEKKKRNLSPFVWTGLGLTVAAAAATGVFWGMADSANDDFNKWDTLISNGAPNDVDSDTWVTNRNNAESEVDRNSYLAWGFGLGAGAFAVTTGILFLVDRKNKKEQRTVAATPGGIQISF